MRSFEDYVRRHLALMVGIHVCGFKSDAQDGTFKRGVKVLQADEDMLAVMKDMYEFITEQKVELPPETYREAVQQAARGMVNTSGPSDKENANVDRAKASTGSARPGQGPGASGSKSGAGGSQTGASGSRAADQARPGTSGHSTGRG